MSISHNDIENQLKEPVMIDPTEPQTPVAKVLLIAGTPALAEKMKAEMLRDSGVDGQVRNGTLVDAILDPTQDWKTLDFVVFEITNEVTDLFALEKLKRRPDRSVHCIGVVQGELDPEVAQKFRDAGAHDVVAMTPITTTVADVVEPEVADVVTASPAEDEQTHNSNGEVIVVLRARGGAGATTLAVNMAVAQAQKSEPGRTALVDLDIQNGSIALALDLPESSEMTRFLKGQVEPGSEFLNAAMERHKSGLDVLCAPDLFAPLTSISLEMIESLIKALSKKYDTIFIDMPQAILDWSSVVMDLAAQAILVSDMTLPSLKRSKRLSDLIAGEHMTLPIKMVINFEKRPLVRSAMQKEASMLVGHPLDYWVPDADKVTKRATDMGQPLMIGSKRSPIAKAITGITKSIVGTKKKEAE